MNKKKLNRILSLVLTLVLVLSCLPGVVLTAFAAETSGTCGENLTWEYDETTKTLTISGTGAMTEYDFNKVPWFEWRSDIENLEIGNGVTTISNRAFSWTMITEVVIPDTVVSIAEGAFYFCGSLKAVTIPDSVTTIGPSAFSGCDSLTSIELPAGLTDLDPSVFYSCEALESIDVDSGNTSFVAVDGVLFNADKTILVKYPANKAGASYTIPSTVKTIGTYAFSWYKNLETITIPSNVETIGMGAFIGGKNYVYLNLSEGLTSIGEKAFWPIMLKGTVILPSTLTYLGNYVFSTTDGYYHYRGTEAEWNTNVTVGSSNQLLNACLQFCTETDADNDHVCDICDNETPCVDSDSNCDVCGEHLVPAFKIEDNKLYVSYDNSYSWEEIGSVADGKSVENIRKTGTNGNIDTYTITYSDGSTSTFTVTNGKDGADGVTPQFKVENSILYVSYDEGQTWTSLGSLKGDKGDQGEQGEQGDKGETGNGIARIEKTSSEGLVDTYTITYTDGTTATFTVTNGAQGIQGIQGEKGDKGDAPVITIQNGNWYIDGVDSGVAATGIKGDTGNGISDISKTKTEGLVDTYTVTYTDGTTTTFTVTNGEKGDKGDQGEQGIQGIQGVPGKDGHTPVITIVDGYWHIDGVNTNILAVGAKGEDGKDGADGKDGKDGLNGKDGKDGVDGKDGKDGITPKLRINDDNIWEVSYDNGQTWESLGVAASGADGVTPQLRINGDTNMWEVSYDNGETWTSMGVVATGADGKDGGSVLPIIFSCISLAGMVIMFCVMMADRKKKAYAGR